MSEVPLDATRAEDRGVPWKLVVWVADRRLRGRVPADERRAASVSFVFFSVKTRLIWLILLSMAIGAVLGTVGRNWWQRPRYRRAISRSGPWQRVSFRGDADAFGICP